MSDYNNPETMYFNDVDSSLQAKRVSDDTVFVKAQGPRDEVIVHLSIGDTRLLIKELQRITKDAEE